MKKITLSKLTVAISLLLGTNSGATAQIFSYTGAVQTYAVPTGISSLTIDAIGATGGDKDPSNKGGAGGRVQCSMSVTSGQILYLYVGGVGVNGSSGVKGAGGWNGGGKGGSAYGAGGGGGTDIRTGGTALSDRVIVAGAGGGGGYNCSSANQGGYGGGLSGEAGYGCSINTNLCQSGAGGTQTSGGTSGTCYLLGSGVAGVGDSAYSYGGGGGGGYYGGGAGAYAGGGGGSSYTDASTITGVTLTPAYNTTGNGSIAITTCTLPTVSIIGGTTTVTVSASQTLTDATTGGVWSSSNTAVATVGTSGVYTGMSVGTAVISYSVTNSCGTTSVNTTVTVTSSTLGAANLSVSNGINVYPNPSTGKVNIQWSSLQTGSGTIRVTDIAGREVYNSALLINSASGTRQINLSNLSKGVYLISVKSDNINYNGKLLLEQ